MKAAVRCESLDMAGLARAEKHGRRDDWIGKQRKIRDRKPLVAGGLNLLERYEKHTEGETEQGLRSRFFISSCVSRPRC